MRCWPPFCSSPSCSVFRSTYTAYLFVEDTARRDLQDRLERMADEIIAQEGTGGVVVGGLDTSSLRLLVPADGRVVVVYPTPENVAARLDIGAPVVESPIVESLSMGTSGSLRIEVPSESLRTLQQQVLAAVTLLVLLSVAVGALVAVVTARRLADPLRDVARRAARLAEGDFRPDPRRHGIPELDRVSDVLDAATVEISNRLQREHAPGRRRLPPVAVAADGDPAATRRTVHPRRPGGRRGGRGRDGAGGPVDRCDHRPGPASRNSAAELRTEVSVVGELDRRDRRLARPVPGGRPRTGAQRRPVVAVVGDGIAVA